MKGKRAIVFSILLLTIFLLPLMKGKEVQSTQAIKDNGEISIDTSLEKEEEKSPNEESKNEDIIFPSTITILDVAETVPVNILEEPLENSKSLGVVYGSLMNVDIIKPLENGYTQVDTWDYKTMKSISGFVPTKLIKEIDLKEKYGVVVDLSEQEVYIFEDEALVKTFSCSTGVDEDNHFTPTGFYRLGDRGESFYSPKYKQGGYNWVRFNNNYLFHSVPFDENGNLIPEEMAKLGEKASHGCIRLSMEDSKWFYNHIPKGTPVIIRN